MRVQITRATVAGRMARAPGEVVDLPDVEAYELIRLGKAIALVGAAPVRESASMEAPEKSVLAKPSPKMGAKGK